MAFLETAGVDRKERFSLLLLEPGEIYFQDFSAVCYPYDGSDAEAVKRKQKGRLKLCSKSVVFDPKDTNYPIMKFPLRDVVSVEKWEPPLLSRLDHKSTMILLQAEQVVQMKADNVVAPYIFSRGQKRYLFGLVYATVQDCLPHICQLLRASTLPPGDQAAMIRAIVVSRQSQVSFDTSWLDDLYEKIVTEVQGERITPLVTNPGVIMLTSSKLYFQSFNNIGQHPVLKIRLSSIRRLIKRRFLLRHVGLEIYSRESTPTSTKHLYLKLADSETRDSLYHKIVEQSDVQLEDLGQENMTLRWQNGVISNFEYLTYLNSLADRSINDLTQYPVFPWVITDFSSSQLDLTNPNTFRDLSRPIGALGESRLHRLLERYHDMPDPKFLYGSHYSTPGFVLFYLARSAPEYMLCLQTGKFDQPDRMFNSVSDAWNNCTTSYTDFKELIPEFYDSDGEFLLNSERINFGCRQDGRAVGNVELPPWASDAADFVRKMRDALESDYVSDHLHHWIDLIFGFKQSGAEAEKAHNVFYYLTYEGAIDFQSIRDLNERAAIEVQVMEFGQIPKQLFKKPHPKRSVGGLPLAINMFHFGMSETASKAKQPANLEESAAVMPKTAPEQNPSIKSCDMCSLECFLEHFLHKGSVSDLAWSEDSSAVFSVSQDTMLKMYCTEEQRQLRSVSLSSMPLSSCVTLPQRKSVIVGGWDNSIYVYSLEYGRVLDTLHAHDDAVSCVCLNTDILVSASWDSFVKIWKCNTDCLQGRSLAQPLAELDHDTGVSALSLAPDNRLVASGTRDGLVCLWNAETGQLLSHQQAHLGPVHAVQLSGDGQRLLSAGEDGYLRILDTLTGTEVCAKQLQFDLRCVSWDDKTVLAGTGTGELVIFDLMTVQIKKTFQAHTGSVNCIAVSPTGKVATGGEARQVKLFKSCPV